MGKLSEIQSEYALKIEKIMFLNKEFNIIKSKVFSNKKRKLKKIKFEISEINNFIIKKDIEIMPEFRIVENHNGGTIISNMIATFYPSRDLLLSNLKKIEQDISSFENEQNFKKTLYIAIAAFLISLAPYISDGIKYIASLF